MEKRYRKLLCRGLALLLSLSVCGGGLARPMGRAVSGTEQKPLLIPGPETEGLTELLERAPKGEMRPERDAAGKEEGEPGPEAEIEAGLESETEREGAETEPPKNPYKDVPEGSWFYGAVMDVRRLNLFAGVTADSFGPQLTMSRGMFVTVLGKMAKVNPAEHQSRQFVDIPAKAYYEAYVNWAAEMGLVSGTGVGRFSPNLPVTREQACIIFNRFAMVEKIQLQEIDTKDPGFRDVKGLSEIAQTSIANLYSAALVSGQSADVFAPRKGMTRAEAAQLFNTVYHSFYNVEEVVPQGMSLLFEVSFPGYWHGKSAYEVLVSPDSQACRLTVKSKANFSNPDHGMLFQLIVVEQEKILESGVYDDAGEIRVGYRRLHTVVKDEVVYSVFLYRPTERQYNDRNLDEVREYTRLEWGVETVAESIRYAEGCRVING